MSILEYRNMTWDEHLEWCKKRAHEYVDRGDLANAVASMGSDVTKHPEGLKDGPTVSALILVALMDVAKGDVQAVRRWIDGWH
jgi:hypothetical protein